MPAMPWNFFQLWAGDFWECVFKVGFQKKRGRPIILLAEHYPPEELLGWPHLESLGGKSEKSFKRDLFENREWSALKFARRRLTLLFYFTVSMTSTKESQSLFACCFFVSPLHPHTLFSLNHQLNCIADFFLFSLYLFATLLLLLVCFIFARIYAISPMPIAWIVSIYFSIFIFIACRIFRYVFVRLF